MVRLINTPTLQLILAHHAKINTVVFAEHFVASLPICNMDLGMVVSTAIYHFEGFTPSI